MSPLTLSPTYKLSHILGANVNGDLFKVTSTPADFASDLSPHVASKNAKLIIKALKLMPGNESGNDPDTAAVKCVALVCAELAENTQGLTGADVLLSHPHVTLLVVLGASPALRSRLSPELRKKAEGLAVFNSEASKAIVAEVDKELYSTPEQLLDRAQGTSTIPQFALRFQTTLSLLSMPPKDPQNKFVALVGEQDRETFGYVLNKKHADFKALVTELLSAYNARKANYAGATNAVQKTQYPPAQLNAAAVEPPEKQRGSSKPSASQSSHSWFTPSAPKQTDEQRRGRESSNDTRKKPSDNSNSYKRTAKSFHADSGRSRKSPDRRSLSRGSGTSNSSSGPESRPRYNCPVCRSNDHNASSCGGIAGRFSDDPDCDCPIEGHYHKMAACRLLKNLNVKLIKAHRSHKGNDRAKSSKGKIKESKQRKQRSDSDSGSGSGSEKAHPMPRPRAPPLAALPSPPRALYTPISIPFLRINIFQKLLIERETHLLTKHY